MYIWCICGALSTLEIWSSPNATRPRRCAPETASTSGLRSDGYRHQQAEILRSAASRNWLLWIARATTACQQSSGEFSSAPFDDVNERSKVANQSSRLASCLTLPAKYCSVILAGFL